MTKHYTRTAKSLHWLMAVLLIGLLALGFYMHDLPLSPEKLQLYAWHKWAGVSAFLLALLRLLWRVTHRPPALPTSLPQSMQLAAHVGHALLYSLMFAIPLSGWLMSSATSPPMLRAATANNPQPQRRITMKKLNQLTAALVLATAVAAAIATPASAAPETFVLDGTHSYPRFSYSHFGFSTQLSRFNKTSGKIVFDKAAKTGAVDIVIDMKSVDTGYPTFNEHIQGEDFLDTAKFPTATFKSTKVNFAGDKPSTVEGKLTIKGVSKAVVLTLSSFQAMPHPMLKKDAIGANASVTVKRSEFNAGKYAPYVGDEVTIDIAVEAIKE